MLTSLDVTPFNTYKVTDMGGMFARCGRIKNLNLSNFDTSNVKNMGGMFLDSTNLSSILVGANWKTSENNERMFDNCGVSEVTVEQP